MPVPGTQEIRRPLLEALGGENPRNFRINEYMKLTAENFGQNIDAMSPRERNELKDNINEALSYLAMKHLISHPSKQVYMITQKGKKVLEETTGLIEDEAKPVIAEAVVPLPDEPIAESETVSEPVALPDDDNQTQESDSLSDAEDLPQEVDSFPDTEEEQAQDFDSLPDAEDLPQEADSFPDTEEEQAQDFDSLPDAEELTQEADTMPEVEDELQKPELSPDVETQAQEFDSALPEELPQMSDAAEELQEIDYLPDSDAEDLTQDFDSLPDVDDMSDNEQQPAEPETSPDDEILPPSDANTLDYIDEVDPDMPTDEITEDYSDAVIQSLDIEDVLERHNSELADKVLMRAAGLHPDMFPTFVTDLLSKMGYNVFKNARYTSDASGNSMIHGVILDPKAQTPIYIHAEKLSPGRRKVGHEGFCR